MGTELSTLLEPTDGLPGDNSKAIIQSLKVSKDVNKI